jgi:ATP-binding cassette, subfamily A (ABC1), member 3
MQTKVRESMYIIGMRGLHYYLSWFVRYFAVYLLVHLVGSITLSADLKYVPFYVPFLVFILFDVVLIIQNFFIQVFLSRAKIGIVIALLFFLVQYILSFIATNSDNPTLAANRAISIIPHVAFVLAFRTMLYA